MKKRILSICLVFCLVLTLVPVSAQAASVTGRSNETVVYDYLVNTMGLNPAAACGVLACISKESGFSPTAGGSYYGLCQWGSSRKTKLMNYCSSNGYDYTTLTGQLHFLEYELNNTYSSVGSYLRSVTNDTAGAYKAGYYFSYYYLLPSNRESTSISRGCLAMNTYCPVYGVSVDTDPCASGHTLLTKNAKAATCVSEGYTGDKVCAICGKTVETGSTIAVTEHAPARCHESGGAGARERGTGDAVWR
ncbi:MAG: phage tail-type lysozyme domain-containing protein, partial [Oscillospiraceae bacterium]|nr:phage tail-type lysozyme domain-containing protein [Oscillospiraceae bacterium]